MPFDRHRCSLGRASIRNVVRLALIVSFVVTTSSTKTFAQAPTTLKGNPLAGAIDFHVHSGPDSFTRSTTDFEIARIAKLRGMGALVLKNHFTMTADRAYLAEKVTGMRCYGGIVLNRAVGGLNPAAIERMVTFTGNKGRIVWLPTFDAENHVRYFKETRPSVPVARDGKLVPELKPIFALIAKHNLVLETGHSSAAECLLLIRAAKQAGVKRIVVTHAMADPIGMTTAQLKEVAKLGAKIECVWMTNLTGPKSHLASMRYWRQVTTADYAKAIRAVGVEHFLLASDLGQYLNPIPTDGMKAFLLQLREAGFTDREIRRLCHDTPAALLGMKAEKKDSGK
jgi:hypothetical protein